MSEADEGQVLKFRGVEWLTFVWARVEPRRSEATRLRTVNTSTSTGTGLSLLNLILVAAMQPKIWWNQR
jgi:hypothetical protein